MKTTKLDLSKIKINIPDFSIHPDCSLTIEFEDKGQDFLYWQVNSDGLVVQCNPFQNEIWKGTYVNLKELKIGKEPLIVTKYGDFTSLNYKVISVNA